jgi:hypothetical protein
MAATGKPVSESTGVRGRQGPASYKNVAHGQDKGWNGVMMRNALVLLAVVALGCGGRSKLVGPRSPGSTGPEPADAAPPRDGLSPFTPDLPPEVSPDGPPPVVPDGPPLVVPPDVARPPDGPPPVTPPDGPPVVRPPDGLPPVAPPDGPPPVAPPDGPPPVAPPDGLPPPPPDVRPDVRPPRPDTLPPAECANGAACVASCTTACQSIGTLTCTCTGGFLSCGQCQVPPITISPEPCPDNPRSTACAQAGLACVVYSNGSISGACLCMTRGNSDTTRWTCIMR